MYATIFTGMPSAQLLRDLLDGGSTHVKYRQSQTDKLMRPETGPSEAEKEIAKLLPV